MRLSKVRSFSKEEFSPWFSMAHKSLAPVILYILLSVFSEVKFCSQSLAALSLKSHFSLWSEIKPQGEGLWKTKICRSSRNLLGFLVHIKPANFQESASPYGPGPHLCPLLTHCCLFWFIQYLEEGSPIFWEPLCNNTTSMHHQVLSNNNLFK